MSEINDTTALGHSIEALSGWVPHACCPVCGNRTELQLSGYEASNDRTPLYCSDRLVGFTQRTQSLNFEAACLNCRSHVCVQIRREDNRVVEIGKEPQT